MNYTDISKPAGGDFSLHGAEPFLNQVELGQMFNNMLNGCACCRVVYLNEVPVDFVYEFVNPAFLELSGIKDPVGFRVTELMPGIGESNPEFIEHFLAVAESGVEERFEFYLTPLKQWYDIYTYSPKKGYFVAIFDKITERKQVEDELHRLTRALKATNSCNSALVHITDEVELLEKVCGIMVEIGGYRMAWVGYAENNQDKSIRSVAHAGFEDGYINTSKITWADAPLGQGPLGMAIRTGKPSCIRDIFHDPVFEPWRAEALCRGYASVQSLPLKAGDEVFGAITVYADLPEAFNEIETDLLTSLADNLGYGITMLRSREAKKHAENELRQSEERFRMLFEEHSAIMLLIDPVTGNFIDANRSASLFYGWSIEDLRKMSIHQVTNVSHEEALMNMEKIRTSEQNLFLFKHQRANGSWRDVEVYSNNIVIDEKEILYAIIHDITERILAAEESDRLKTAFLANISHEIRTPMNGILGFSELLKEPQLSGEEQAEYIDLIHRSGERMLNLINDLMDISRIDAREMSLQVTETSLNRLLRDLERIFKLQAKESKLSLRCTLGLSDQESMIETDSGKLTQILTNLLQNALKFTRVGSIDFGYTLAGSMLRFYVIDSGIGIPPGMEDMIFNRFHQADISITRNHEGAGLGLSITKSFVEMMGGCIMLDSLEGAGSTFSFTLPYTRCPSSSVAAGLEHQNIPDAIDCAPRLTILIAEDDEVSTILLKRNLKDNNVILLLAENGWEAVEMVRHHSEINLVLMDLRMPVMNGFEATVRIKELRPDLPVIAQTAFTSKEDREKAREAGCNHFVNKPLQVRELLEIMKDLL